MGLLLFQGVSLTQVTQSLVFFEIVAFLAILNFKESSYTH